VASGLTHPQTMTNAMNTTPNVIFISHR
jgi:hypothetical protein